MLEWFSDLIHRIIMEYMMGAEVLELVDQYFVSQSEPNRVLIIYGIGILAAIGVFQVVKYIFKKLSGFLRFILLLALAYYVVVIVLGIDIWGIIFGN